MTQFTGHPDWLPTSANPAVRELIENDVNVPAGTRVGVWTDAQILAPLTVVRCDQPLIIDVVTTVPSAAFGQTFTYRAGGVDQTGGAFLMFPSALLANVDIGFINPTAGDLFAAYSIDTWLNVTEEQLRPDRLAAVWNTQNVILGGNGLVLPFPSAGMFDRVAGICSGDQDCDVTIVWVDEHATISETVGSFTAGNGIPFDVPVRAPAGGVWYKNKGASFVVPAVTGRAYRQNGG